ncbi:MAG: MraY family glycosyltransferase [Chitinophagaceae bacterium]
MIYIFIGFLLILFLHWYFRFAEHFNIIDHPNERSSHSKVTIRGGGILFYFGALLYFLINQYSYPFFFAGLTLICIVSFLDDLLTLPHRLRLIAQTISIFLLFYQVGLFWMPWYFVVIALVLATALINAYNFMDGINGLTAGYSFSILLAFWAINYQIIFISNQFIVITTIAVVIFGWFNFRKKARCFAGDIGSVSIAFILLFIDLKLILQKNDILFILFFAVYGVDSGLTLFHRLFQGQNIFKAHRSHLYQYLANEMRWGHIPVALLYIGIQLLINFLILFLYHYPAQAEWWGGGIILVVLAGIYIFAKSRILKKLKLKEI